MALIISGSLTVSSSKTTLGSFEEVVTDPLFADVQFLTHFDGTDGGTDATDVTGNVTMSFDNGATLSNEQAKFGNTSLKINGTTNGRVALTPVLDTTQSEWTLECWAYLVSDANALNFIWCSGNTGTTNVCLSVETAGRIIYSGGTAYTGAINTGSAFGTGTWRHVALVRDSSDVELFMDGVSQGSTTVSGFDFQPTLYTSIIGDQEPGLRQWTGYIDEFRFTAAARYTANFTPPTDPFPDS